jgi:hypothetical protein
LGLVLLYLIVQISLRGWFSDKSGLALIDMARLLKALFLGASDVEN